MTIYRRSARVVAVAMAIPGLLSNAGFADQRPVGNVISDLPMSGGHNPDVEGLPELELSSEPTCAVHAAEKLILPGTCQSALEFNTDGWATEVLRLGSSLLWNSGQSGLGSDNGGSIELGGAFGPNTFGATPYLDFHFGNGQFEDFNVRLINSADRQLDINAELVRLANADLHINDGSLSLTDDDTNRTWWMRHSDGGTELAFGNSAVQSDSNIKFRIHEGGTAVARALKLNFGGIILANTETNRTWWVRHNNHGNELAFGFTNSQSDDNIKFRIHYGGTTEVKVLKITGGADLAEPFPVVSVTNEVTGIEPGMVVVIDPSREGQLKLASEPYDRRVAGIISGANGIKPGLTLQQEGTVASGEHPVALSGRVFVKADATYGSIEPGDMLTTSKTPGHAMKVTDPARAFGTVIGKAMGSLESGTGLVMVLVNLQ